MDKKKADKLKTILKKAEMADPSKVKEEAKDFLRTVDASDLIEAEQTLVDEGMAPETLRHMCPAHMEVMEEQLGSAKDALAPGHPIHTLMSEHEEILKFLDHLEVINQKFQKASKKEDISEKEFDILKHIAHHLEAAEKHHQREEDALFPEVEKCGITGPTQIMRAEHVDIRAHKKALHELVAGDIQDFKKFKEGLDENAGFIVFNLRDHIFKENNILYPMALENIRDEKTWDEIKEKCDKIGYCCFTPKESEGRSHSKKGEETVLDLRPMPPFKRHTKIFQVWDGLKAGESMRIINDHNPKPLHYQFEAELTDRYSWEYLQEGPKDWEVRIGKVK